MTTGGQPSARMNEVGAAGDVNGDGYDDLLTGTEFYSGGISNEGRVQCFYGSAAGPSGAANWTRFGGQSGAWLGTSVATAGDLNRDGYSDVIVTARNYDATYNNEGAAFIYYGGASGLWSSSSFTGGQADTWFGISASTAGDLNGDGFADLLVGAEKHDATHTNAGAMHVYLGNAEAPSGGLDIRPQQRTTTGDPIALLGRSDAADRFVLSLRGRSPQGRDRVRAEWQIAEAGVSIASVPIEAGTWRDTGLPIDGIGSAAAIEETLAGLTPETLYHWRARTRSRSLYTPFTKWVSVAPAPRSTAHLRTGSGASEVAGEALSRSWNGSRPTRCAIGPRCSSICAPRGRSGSRSTMSSAGAWPPSSTSLFRRDPIARPGRERARRERGSRAGSISRGSGPRREWRRKRSG
jgi:hypothetical protein